VKTISLLLEGLEISKHMYDARCMNDMWRHVIMNAVWFIVLMLEWCKHVWCKMYDDHLDKLTMNTMWCIVWCIYDWCKMHDECLFPKVYLVVGYGKLKKGFLLAWSPDTHVKFNDCWCVVEFSWAAWKDEEDLPLL
jgi:hypothetical protein